MQLKIKEIWVYGRLKIPCGETTIVVGAMKTRRNRSIMQRSDWYVSAQFEKDDDSGVRMVYYGRILQVFTYKFQPDSDRRVLLLIDWASEVKYNELGQVFYQLSVTFCIWGSDSRRRVCGSQLRWSL